MFGVNIFASINFIRKKERKEQKKSKFKEIQFELVWNAL